MKHKKVKLSCLFLLALGLTGLQAQQATTAAGGEASGSGGTADYSVGQVTYTTNTGTTGSVLQGVQQPYEIYSIGVTETELDITLSVYPNPTANNLTLQIVDFNNEKLSYQLFDTQGQLLDSKQADGSQTQINTSVLPSSTYFLNIIQENKTIKSFKIIKN